MSQSDIETVLRNWLQQAMLPDGKFSGDVDPSAWVAKNFIDWWRTQVGNSLDSAEQATIRLRSELNRLGKAEELGEATHELTHVQDALSDLRRDLGLSVDEEDSQ